MRQVSGLEKGSNLGFLDLTEFMTLGSFDCRFLCRGRSSQIKQAGQAQSISRPIPIPMAAAAAAAGSGGGARRLPLLVITLLAAAVLSHAAAETCLECKETKSNQGDIDSAVEVSHVAWQAPGQTSRRTLWLTPGTSLPAPPTARTTDEPQEEDAASEVDDNTPASPPPPPRQLRPGVSWQTTSWSDCSVPCGYGNKTRVVRCVDADGQTLSVSECDDSTQPKTTISCRRHPCSTFHIASGAWGPCSAQCNGGVQRRQVFCADPRGLRVSDAYCDAAALNDAREGETTQPCNEETCADYYWQLGSWSECNKQCDFGIKTRTRTCVFAGDNGGPVADAYCADVVPEPKTEQLCNTWACVTYAWDVTPWGDCNATCGEHAFAKRDIACRSSLGEEMGETDTFRCGEGPPESVMRCVGLPACEGVEQVVDVCGEHGLAVAAGGCACYVGWGGPTCAVPSACGGTVAVDSTCCIGPVEASGRCCEEGALLDKRGACCPSGVLDACGVCDGQGKSVDLRGECCESGVLDEEGVCCHSGVVDECNVCDGDGSACGFQVVVTAYVKPDAATPTSSALAQQLTADCDELIPDAANKATLTLEDVATLPASHDYASSPEHGLLVSITLSLQARGRGFPTSWSKATVSSWLRALAHVSHVRPPINRYMAVTSVAREGVCGNGVCEAGERCVAAAEGSNTPYYDDCCDMDCHYTVHACPVPGIGEPECALRGRCLARSGQCDCHVGYAGVACEGCADGWLRGADGECVLGVPMFRYNASLDASVNANMDKAGGHGGALDGPGHARVSWLFVLFVSVGGVAVVGLVGAVVAALVRGRIINPAVVGLGGGGRRLTHTGSNKRLLGGKDSNGGSPSASARELGMGALSLPMRALSLADLPERLARLRSQSWSWAGLGGRTNNKDKPAVVVPIQEAVERGLRHAYEGGDGYEPGLGFHGHSARVHSPNITEGCARATYGAEDERV
eukprot:jgi/Chlat1/7984/Chrsp7S07743